MKHKAPEGNHHGNNFNLLRFIFASLVIVSHVPELQDGNRSNEILTRIFHTISFGEMAVDSFFILSGFLIVKSWQGRPTVIEFLSSRILRIYPGFVVSALLCAFVVGPIYGSSSYFQEFWVSGFLLSLIKLKLSFIPPVFQGSPYPALNGSMWTIPYEFLCYLAVLTTGVTIGFKRKWFVLILFFICAGVHFINRLEFASLPLDIYFRLGMAFSAGALFYLYNISIPWNKKIATISMICFSGLLFIKPLAEPALCIFFGYSVIYYAKFGTTFLRFNQFPDISYGVYLYAWPVNKIVLWAYPNMNVYIAMLVVFLISILFGIFSWYLVEKPFMKLKKVVRQRVHQGARAAI